MKASLTPTALLAAVLLVTSTAQPLAAQFVRGDTSGDQIVNLTDAFQILNWLLYGQALAVPEAADSNDNGVVELADVAYTFHFAITGSSPPPAPFPGPGFDTTLATWPAGPASGVATFQLDNVNGCPGGQAALTLSVSHTEPSKCSRSTISLSARPEPSPPSSSVRPWVYRPPCWS